MSDALRLILVCPSMQNLQVGLPLPISALLHQGIDRGLQPREVCAAIDEGTELCLFKQDRKDYRLTDKGFAAIRCLGIG